ncbi:MAG: GNAT family N-acetyltransferase [Prolixibacteraceae bacterium]|nr:GNAT family N-acetyltransferase [Prolixibacteraceae bacterium]
MDVKQKNDSEKGMFYIEQDGKIVAEMTYVWAGTEKIIINHTEVNEILKGQGAGKQMLSKAVEFAREKGLKIIPLCPFTKSVFDKTPEYGDVL